MKLLSIGIDEYYDLKELHSCANDAREYYRFFKSNLGLPDNDLVLLTKFAETKKANILKKYTEFVDSIAEGETAYFTYSAHGDVFKLSNDQKVYYCEGVYTSDSAIYEFELQKILKKHLRKKSRLISIIDSCHSGGILIAHEVKGLRINSSVSNSLEVRNPFYWRVKRGYALHEASSSILTPLEENRITISASDATELAFADNFNGKMKGVLTHNLISILERNMDITFEQMIAQMNSILPNYKKGYEQSPKLRISENLLHYPLLTKLYNNARKSKV